jgi:hypothetical protein
MIYSYNTLGFYETKGNRQYDNTGNIRVLHHFETNKIPAFQVIVLGTIISASYKLFDIDDVQIATGSVAVENAVREDSTVYSRLIFLGTTLASKDDGFYYMEITYTNSGSYSGYSALGQTSRDWIGMTSAPNGNVYATVDGGDIYMQTGGTGNFIALSQTSRDWRQIAAAPNGNIYAVVSSGDIYMQTGGTGNFIALSQSTRNWYGITVAANGNAYASVNTGDIYMQTGGTGAFVALSQTTRLWRGMTVANGNVYACTTLGDIYMQTGGADDFEALLQTTRLWHGMAAASNGDVYAIVLGGETYVQRNGTGQFVSIDDQTELWRDITVDADDSIYSCVYGEDIYEQTLSAGGDNLAYTDVFCWQTDVSEYLKIEATTSNMVIGGFEMNMTGFTYLVYLEVKENGFTEEYPIEEEGKSKTFGDVGYFTSRNHEQQFEITGYRKTLGFLAGLRTVHTNGTVTLTYKNDISEIYDIESPDAAQSYTYSDILIINWKFKLVDYLQTTNKV